MSCSLVGRNPNKGYLLSETLSWVSKVLLPLCVGKTLDHDYVEDIILSMSIGLVLK